jgi:hypothetical protein
MRRRPENGPEAANGGNRRAEPAQQALPIARHLRDGAVEVFGGHVHLGESGFQSAIRLRFDAGRRAVAPRCAVRSRETDDGQQHGKANAEARTPARRSPGVTGAIRLPGRHLKLIERGRPRRMLLMLLRIALVKVQGTPQQLIIHLSIIRPEGHGPIPPYPALFTNNEKKDTGDLLFDYCE